MRRSILRVESRPHQLLLHVEDTGTGVPAADREVVLSRFAAATAARMAEPDSASRLHAASPRRTGHASEQGNGGGRFVLALPGIESRILVVDDEPQILRALQTSLRKTGYEVETATTGEQALTLAAVRPPDAVILSLVLPDRRGTEVAKELRAWSKAPIIVLSVVGDESEKVAALDAGADDYVTKPFGVDELLARLRAALRRVEPSGEPVLEIGDLRIDLEGRKVTENRGTRAADAARVRTAVAAYRPKKIRASCSPTRPSCARSGAKPMPTSPTTSTSTSRSCDASWSPTPHAPARSSRSPGSATGSSIPEGGC